MYIIEYFKFCAERSKLMDKKFESKFLKNNVNVNLLEQGFITTYVDHPCQPSTIAIKLSFPLVSPTGFLYMIKQVKPSNVPLEDLPTNIICIFPRQRQC